MELGGMMTAAGVMIVCYIFILLAMFAFLLAAIGFWIWMIVDCANHEPPGNDKLVWLLIVILLNWVGGIVYYFARRQPRQRGQATPGFFAETSQPPRR